MAVNEEKNNGRLRNGFAAGRAQTAQEIATAPHCIL